VSEIDPTELSVKASPHISEAFSQEPVELAPSAKKAEREGLPPGYRMRADAHYVDNLTSRRGADRPTSEHLRVAPEPAERADSRDRGERLLAQLGEGLATLESAALALTSDTSRMARRVNVDLIRAEVWRAAWSLKAHALVEGRAGFHARPRPLGFLLGHVRNGWAAECRLEDISLQVNASDWNAVVPVDEHAFVTGVTGAIVATLAIVGQVDGATVTLNATCASGELKSIDVVQDEVLVSPSAGARFFDPAWTDRPGGWIAGLGAAVTKAVAHQHGGEAVFLAGDRRGSTVRMTFK
jgi:hypothetical protein